MASDEDLAIEEQLARLKQQDAAEGQLAQWRDQAVMGRESGGVATVGAAGGGVAAPPTPSAQLDDERSQGGGGSVAAEAETYSNQLGGGGPAGGFAPQGEQSSNTHDGLVRRPYLGPTALDPDSFGEKRYRGIHTEDTIRCAIPQDRSVFDSKPCDVVRLGMLTLRTRVLFLPCVTTSTNQGFEMFTSGSTTERRFYILFKPWWWRCFSRDWASEKGRLSPTIVRRQWRARPPRHRRWRQRRNKEDNNLVGSSRSRGGVGLG